MPENANQTTPTSNQNTVSSPQAPPPTNTQVRPEQPPKKIPRIKPKFGKNAMLFIGVLALALFSVLLLVGILVAKTGIIELTLLSRLYHGPLPTRQLIVEPISAVDFVGYLDSRLKQSYAISQVPPFHAVITEREISGALYSALPGALRDSKWNVDKAQIVVREDGLEYFSRFSRGAFKLEVLIVMKPILESGSVRFDVQSIQVGDYSLPVPIAQTLAAYYFGRDLGTWTLTFGSLRIDNIVMHDGYLEIFVNQLK